MRELIDLSLQILDTSIDIPTIEILKELGIQPNSNNKDIVLNMVYNTYMTITYNTVNNEEEIDKLICLLNRWAEKGCVKC